ncbi:MAG: hypothetical protein J6P98_08785 [Clostridia bacterium]|nr:hypothetical protein [Clostridia bacterium]
MSKIKAFFKSDKLKKALSWALIIALLAIVAFTVKSHFDQRSKLSELLREKEELQLEVDRLTREQERLEGNLEYVKSREGLLWYAREYLGYLGAEDIRIYLDH